MNNMIEYQTKPLISVVMATYNGEKFLRKQLDSIISQSYKLIEIIITDDASTDTTLQILNEYQRKESNIHIIKNQSNRGQKQCLQDALMQAKGEYIAIADQDDIWLPNKLEALADHIGDSSAIYSNSCLINADDKELNVDLLTLIKIKPPISGKSFWPLVPKNCVSAHAMLFRKSLLDITLPFNREKLSTFDHQLALAATICGGLKFYPQALVMHRSHENNQANIFFRKVDKSLTENRKYRSAKINNEHWRAVITTVLELLCKSGLKNTKDYMSAEALVKELQKFDEAGLNFRALYLLLLNRNKLFKGKSFLKKLRKCTKLAKGERCYK